MSEVITGTVLVALTVNEHPQQFNIPKYMPLKKGQKLKDEERQEVKRSVVGALALTTENKLITEDELVCLRALLPTWALRVTEQPKMADSATQQEAVDATNNTEQTSTSATPKATRIQK